MFFAALAVGHAGCIFSPDKAKGKKPDPPPVYPKLEYPERVLSALRIAYENRDSVGYRKLFDYEYKGESRDLTDGSLETFRNADEVAHIQALAREASIVKVTMDLGAETSWTRLQSDDLSHPEWAVIQIGGTNFRIVVDVSGGNGWIVSGDEETFTFRFKPSTPETSSATDTLWNIIGWDETRSP